MAKVLGALVLVIALVFGYFLQKSNWDFVLAKSMISFELNKLMNNKKSSEESTDAAPADAEPAQTTPAKPNQPSPTKDSMYKDGNSFSDIKHTGNEANYQPAP